VAGGHQPLGNEDGSVTIVFNGEIYNHHALRATLQERGHVFRTQSDTEAIVHLYEEYGSACVQHLDGMFAFAIWDTRQGEGTSGKLFLARDRVGKKPLYYADTGSTLIFGSELKAVTCHPAVRREINAQGVHDYLSLGQVPRDASIYESVRKLLPGHVLEASMAHPPQVRRYWSWPVPDAERRDGGAETVRTVRDLLLRAVEKRLEAEVPLGVYLSGGLDSGIVAAMAARLRGGIDTFAVGFEGPASHNELPLSRVTSRHIGSRHHEFLFKPDIVQLLPEILQATDEPFAISSSIPLLLLSRAARKQVTVVLTGDGGDEVLGGYTYYLYERWARALRSLPLSPRLLHQVAGLLPGPVTSYTGAWRKRVRHLVRNAGRPAAQRRLDWAGWFDEEDKWKLYSAETRARAQERGVSATHQRLQKLVHSESDDPAENTNHLDAVVWLPDEMLTKVDRMTMSASVEARCPLLDRDLIEYCARLPMRVRVPGNRDTHLKAILRQVGAEFLPREVLRGRKRGFNVPLDAWFRGHARGYLEHHLGPERVRRCGFFDAEAVTALMREHQSGFANHANRLFALLTFHVWAEQSS
jgi:asparagine synthase (glutamine-hydrolysing)